ncbi:MAG TPA: hypothetical protein PKC97_08285 [Burkholderiaceae bacterium]|nr:hypothetical protein [Burkholderiaceae bacterium]
MRWAAIVLALLLAGNAFAHGGEDHGDGAAATPAAAVEAGPRATATSEDFELVALTQGDKLLIYLDRFATNEPVAGATIEIESGAFKAVAAAVAPGVYSVAGDAFETPGRHALTVTIETDAKSGAVSDLLSATLDVAAPKTAAPEGNSPLTLAGLSPTTLAFGVAVVLLAIGAIAWRRRARARAEGSTR